MLPATYTMVPLNILVSERRLYRQRRARAGLVLGVAIAVRRRGRLGITVCVVGRGCFLDNCPSLAIGLGNRAFAVGSRRPE